MKVSASIKIIQAEDDKNEINEILKMKTIGIWRLDYSRSADSLHF